MKYLRVKNWEKLQHQSEKPLPWIKFFTALLAPTKEPAYSDWNDQTKALLHHIWLMARVFNDHIPETWLTREKLNLKSRVDLSPILDSGFAWFEDENGNRLSHSRTRDARSVLSKSNSLSSTEGEREGEDDLEAEFSALWAGHPLRLRRRGAFRHYVAERKKGATFAEFLEAQRRYKAHLFANPWKKPQQGDTWFLNWRDWLNFEEAQLPDANPGVHVGANPETAKDRFHRDRIEPWLTANPKRFGGDRAAWEACFAAHFGFTPDEWNDADDAQVEQWAARFQEVHA